MYTTIDYTNLPPDHKADKAIADTRSYLGDRFNHIIALFTEEIELGHFTTRQQVHFAMSFAGVQGYPVEALIEKYWPELADVEPGNAEPGNADAAAAAVDE